MTTIEKLGWIALVLTLIVAVAAVIIQPIYDKAVDTKREIEEIQFEDPQEVTFNHIDIIDVGFYAKVEPKDNVNIG